MTGGASSDSYIVDNAGDVVTEQQNGGADDSVFSFVSYYFGGLFVYIAAAPAFVLGILRLRQDQFYWLFVPAISGLVLGAMLAENHASCWACEVQISVTCQPPSMGPAACAMNPALSLTWSRMYGASRSYSSWVIPGSSAVIMTAIEVPPCCHGNYVPPQM